jgi:hypothetical protein
MKYLILVCLCMAMGCNDTFKDDPGWDTRAAAQVAKDLGESSPKVTCNHGDYRQTSWCAITVKDRVYSLRCRHDNGCWLSND